MLRQKHFVRHISGATAIEYGLIVALIAVVLIFGARTLGNGLGSNVNSTNAEINNAIGK